MRWVNICTSASECEPESETAVVTAEAQEDSVEEEAPSEIDDADASAEDGIEENVPILKR